MFAIYAKYNCARCRLSADNRVRAPRKMHFKDFSVFNQPDDHNYPRLSPQLALAAFQYLSTSKFFALFLVMIYSQ